MFKKTALVAVLIICLGSLGAGGYLLYHTLEGVMSLAEASAGHVEDKSLIDDLYQDYSPEPSTFLIYGVDTGEWIDGDYRDGTGRADTIILVKVFPDKNEASLLSIPRDTLVEIPGKGSDKVNHAYNYGKAELLAETVENFAGIPVDYHVGLEYTVFRDTVKLLEGVEVEVDRTIDSRGIILHPGVQVLDGKEAFALVSCRSDPLGDIDRVERQQRFIKAMIDEASDKSLDELLFSLMAVWKNLDTDLEMIEAVLLGYKLKDIREEDVAMETVPGWFYNPNGVSYWDPDDRETEEKIDILFKGES